MKILLATDGSDFSKSAAEKCCELLYGNGPLEVNILSAFEAMPAFATEPFAVSAEYYHDMIEAMKEQAKQNVDAAEAIIKKICPDASTTLTVISGKPATAIVDTADQWGADLVVVGSHGRGFWGRMLGSVSNAVVNHAHCSVLVVRPEDE